MTPLRDAAENATAGVPVVPERIWATVNGASTRLPDGVRQFIGGWSEDPTRPRAVEYVKASALDTARAEIERLNERLNTAYRVKAKCNDDANFERRRATAIRALTHPTPASDDQVEAAAKALYEEDDPWNAAFPWPNPSDGPERAEAYRRLARAALAAMGSTKP